MVVNTGGTDGGGLVTDDFALEMNQAVQQISNYKAFNSINAGKTIAAVTVDFVT